MPEATESVAQITSQFLPALFLWVITLTLVFIGLAVPQERNSVISTRDGRRVWGRSHDARRPGEYQMRFKQHPDPNVVVSEPDLWQTVS